MQIIMHVKIPHQQFNSAVADGTVGQKINRIIEEARPEAVYFTEYDGKRGAIMVVNLDDSAKIPSLAEPWFLLFNADVEFHVAMTPSVLEQAGLDQIAKKWVS